MEIKTRKALWSGLRTVFATRSFIVRQEILSGDDTIIRLNSALDRYIQNSADMPELRDLLSVCKEYTQDTSFYCGKGGHHVWVHNKNHKRVLFIGVVND